jgi:hypothetical protein
VAPGTVQQGAAPAQECAWPWCPRLGARVPCQGDAVTLRPRRATSSPEPLPVPGRAGQVTTDRKPCPWHLATVPGQPGPQCHHQLSLGASGGLPRVGPPVTPPPPSQWSPVSATAVTPAPKSTHWLSFLFSISSKNSALNAGVAKNLASYA